MSPRQARMSAGSMLESLKTLKRQEHRPQARMSTARAVLGSLKTLWTRLISSKHTLLSLQGKELLVFEHSPWVYHIEARRWLQLDSQLVPPPEGSLVYTFQGSSKGLLCVAGCYGDLGTTNPLQQASVQLPKFDVKTLMHFKCVVPYEDSGRFKVLAIAQLKDSEGHHHEVCKRFDPMTDEWVSIENMPMKWSYGMFQHQKVAGATGRIYFARAEDDPLFGGGVVAYNTRSDSWEVVVDALPRGVITNRLCEVLRQAFKLGMDCVLAHPNLFEFDGHLMLIGQVVSIENEEVKEYVAIWKLDLGVEKESRAWVELTRVPADLWSSIVSSAFGVGMKQIWTIVAEGRVFITSIHYDTMVMCDLSTLQWEWLPKCPVKQWFHSGCAYRPQLELKPQTS